MALSFWQKLKLAWRGWSRRQDETAAKRKAEFLEKELRWGNLPSKPAEAAPPAPAPASAIDWEGLQVAYLDDSGRIDYYLDRDSGEVLERRVGEAPPAGARYRKVPRRSDASDDEDRRAFAATVEDAALGARLLAAGSEEFRRLIAADRAIERKWYQFKNDRATKAIEAWMGA